MGEQRRKKDASLEEKKELNEKRIGDGCTSSPDFNFTDCCNQHDKDYGEAKISRWQADKKLRVCISKKGVGFYNFKILPWVYWGGVRVFGGKYYGSSRQKKCKICNYFRNKTANFKKYFL